MDSGGVEVVNRPFEERDALEGMGAAEIEDMQRTISARPRIGDRPLQPEEPPDILHLDRPVDAPLPAPRGLLLARDDDALGPPVEPAFDRRDEPLLPSVVAIP